MMIITTIIEEDNILHEHTRYRDDFRAVFVSVNTTEITSLLIDAYNIMTAR
jgi:hypothetical protein